MVNKRATIWAYRDGVALCDVVKVGLEWMGITNEYVRQVMREHPYAYFDEVKARLVRENPGHKVTFKYI
jgi:hypothetical protein